MNHSFIERSLRVATLACAIVVAAPARAEPGAEIFVRSQGRTVMVDEIVDGSARHLCRTPCRIAATVSRHRFQFSSLDAPAVEETIDVRRDARVDVDPGSRDWRVVGAILGAVGVAACFGGLMTLEKASTTHAEEPPKWAFPFVVGGIVVAGVGLGLFLESATTVTIEGRPVRAPTLAVVGSF